MRTNTISPDLAGLAKKIWIDRLGVKYEFDLRASGSRDPDFPVANYIKFDATAEYDEVDGTGIYSDVIKSELLSLFDAVKTGPILAHCNMGCDRTGTLCFYIEAILGMSDTDIDIDYELSSLTDDHNTYSQNTFSSAPAFASDRFYEKISDDEYERIETEPLDWSVHYNNYYHESLNFVRDRLDSKGTTRWCYLKSMFDSYSGDTLSDRVIHYLLSIGITANELNEFRSTMCDGTPSIIVQPIINLISLDRTYEALTTGENISNHLANDKAYTNIAYGNGNAVDTGTNCTLNTGKTEITIRDLGTGGVCVGFPISIDANSTYNISLDYSGDNKARIYARFFKADGVAYSNNTIYYDDEGGEDGTINESLTSPNDAAWLVLYLGANTRGTKTFGNIVITRE